MWVFDLIKAKKMFGWVFKNWVWSRIPNILRYIKEVQYGGFYYMWDYVCFITYLYFCLFPFIYTTKQKKKLYFFPHIININTF